MPPTLRDEARLAIWEAGSNLHFSCALASGNLRPSADRGKRRLAWPDQEISEIPVPMAVQMTQMRQRLELYEERRQASCLRQALKDADVSAKRPRRSNPVCTRIANRLAKARFHEPGGRCRVCQSMPTWLRSRVESPCPTRALPTGSPTGKKEGPLSTAPR
jgi:hypothetical protein